MRDDREPYLSTSQVARVLGISRQTLYNWLRAGKIPEPKRHPLTNYPRWTDKDLAELRMRLAHEEL